MMYLLKLLVIFQVNYCATAVSCYWSHSYNCQNVPESNLFHTGLYNSWPDFPYFPLDDVCTLENINDIETLENVIGEIISYRYRWNNETRYYWFGSNGLDCSSWIWENSILTTDGTCRSITCENYCVLQLDFYVGFWQDITVSVQILPNYQGCAEQAICETHYDGYEIHFLPSYCTCCRRIDEIPCGLCNGTTWANLDKPSLHNIADYMWRTYCTRNSSSVGVAVWVKSSSLLYSQWTWMSNKLSANDIQDPYVCSRNCSVLLDLVCHSDYIAISIERFSALDYYSDRYHIGLCVADQNADKTQDKLENALEEINNKSVIAQNETNEIVNIISTLLQETTQQTAATAESIFDVADSLAGKVDLSNGTYQYATENVAVAVVNTSRIAEGENSGYTFGSLGSINDVQLFAGEPSERITSYILVPEGVIPRKAGSRISFAAFASNKFNSESADSIVSTLILSASLFENGTKQNATFTAEVVTLRFAITGTNSPAGISCAFWNSTLLGWSREGLLTAGRTKNSVNCSSSHLTNFATLFVRGYEGNGRDQIGTDYVTIVGCCISLLGLFATIAVFTLLPKTRAGGKLRGAVLLVNYASALILLNLFLIASQFDVVKNSAESCTAIAVIIHFSLLATFGWMLVEGAIFFSAVVLPIFTHNHLTNRTVFITAVIVGWVCPAVIVSGSIGSNPQRYRRSDNQCWIVPKDIPYLVIAPTAVAMAINLIVYVVVVAKMTCFKSVERKNQTSLKNLGFSVCLLVTLGITWVFGFALSGINLGSASALAYIFTFANSLQGIFLFLVFVIRNKETRREVNKELSGAIHLPTVFSPKQSGIYHVTSTSSAPTSNTAKAPTQGPKENARPSKRCRLTNYF